MGLTPYGKKQTRVRVEDRVARNRASKENEAQRLRECEELMVRGIATRNLLHRLSERWGVSERTVQGYQRKVRAAWIAESAGLDRTEKRADHRGRLLKLYEKAMTKRAPIKTPEGGHVLDKHGNQVTVEAPDLRTANRVLAEMAKLDNLNEETVKVENADNLVDLLRMGTLMESKLPKNERKVRFGKNGKNGANGHGANGGGNGHG